MELYFSPISAYSHKVLVAFHEKGIAFTPRVMNLADSSERESLRQVHPLGKVPCLRVGGAVVPESSNIIEWLDQHYQVDKLIPSKADEARQVRLLDRMADQYLSANAIMLFFQSLKPVEQQDVDRQATARRQINVIYSDLEQRLLERVGPWLVGDQLTLADISVAAGLMPSVGFIPLDNHPTLAAYLDNWQQRTSFIRAREGFNGAMERMVDAMVGREEPQPA